MDARNLRRSFLYCHRAPGGGTVAIKVSARAAERGESVTVTATPDSGYVLGALTVTDSSGNNLSLAERDGKFTFTMPAGAVEVAARFAKAAEAPLFADVTKGAYCSDAVKWAVENSITGGIGNNRFGPKEPCSRARIVTFLWRAAGSPQADAAATVRLMFPHRRWLCAGRSLGGKPDGIVQGYGNGCFGPEDEITREQLAVMLYRFAKAQGQDTAQGGMAVREYSDFEELSHYAGEAMGMGGEHRRFARGIRTG